MSLDPLIAQNYERLAKENPNVIQSLLRMAYNAGRYDMLLEQMRKDAARNHPHQPDIGKAPAIGRAQKTRGTRHVSATNPHPLQDAPPPHRLVLCRHDWRHRARPRPDLLGTDSVGKEAQ